MSNRFFIESKKTNPSTFATADIRTTPTFPGSGVHAVEYDPFFVHILN